MTSLQALLARAADTADCTPAERAAALSAATRFAPPDPTWPDPPPGWHWLDGRVVRCQQASIVPPLRGAPVKAEESAPAPAEPTRPLQPRAAPEAPRPPASDIRPPRPGSNAARVIEMLRRPQGASVREMVEEFGCKEISVRALVSVNAKRVGAKVENIGGRYRAHGGVPLLIGIDNSEAGAGSD